jgi:hypothetical protein
MVDFKMKLEFGPDPFILTTKFKLHLCTKKKGKHPDMHGHKEIMKNNSEGLPIKEPLLES